LKIGHTIYRRDLSPAQHGWITAVRAVAAAEEAGFISVEDEEDED
jgi:hypothetical protein